MKASSKIISLVIPVNLACHFGISVLPVTSAKSGFGNINRHNSRKMATGQEDDKVGRALELPNVAPFILGYRIIMHDGN